ncbi:MAG TPA: hypothetical protein VE153_08780, partial [Myxococcus sp.]|nr:hypothetical protein [Myxococcus sp.]
VIYARAEARAARVRREAPAPEPVPALQEEAPLTVDPAWLAAPDLRSDVLAPETAALDADGEAAAFELKLRTWVLPVALGLGWLVATGSLRFVARLFTMLVHESGHAVTAWLCGVPALPTLWVTLSASSRWYSFAALLAAGLGVLAWRGWQRRQWGQVALGAGLLAAQAVCTLGLSYEKARALITFGGDAGMMVLGTALMASFYVRPGSYLHEHGLRWGFVPIGALSFWDAFSSWWRARTNVDWIPFGRIEGVGLSDPSRLVDDYGWPVGTMIRRHVGVGVACLVVLARLYVFHLVRARARLKPQPPAPTLP